MGAPPREPWVAIDCGPPISSGPAPDESAGPTLIDASAGGRDPRAGLLPPNELAGRLGEGVEGEARGVGRPPEGASSHVVAKAQVVCLMAGRHSAALRFLASSRDNDLAGGRRAGRSD